MSQDHGEQNVSEFYVYVIHHLAAANRARAGQPFLSYAVRTSMGHRGWPMQPARGLSGHDPGRDHPDAVAFHDMARRARPLADRRFGAPIDRRRGRPRACRVSRRGQLNGKGRPKTAFK
jgi:hypothetical protein